MPTFETETAPEEEEDIMRLENWWKKQIYDTQTIQHFWQQMGQK